MDTTDKHSLEQRLCVSNSDHTQTPDTRPTTTNEQKRESPIVTILSNDNKPLEPIIFETHVNEDQRLKTKYVLKTTLSHLTFWITKPKYISIQSDPFLIRLTAHSYKKRTDNKKHRKEAFCFKGLHILQQLNTYFYFQPSPQYKHIFKEGRPQFTTDLYLRLTDEAKLTRVYIRKGAHLGSLQPILLCKYLNINDTIHNKPPHTSATR